MQRVSDERLNALRELRDNSGSSSYTPIAVLLEHDLRDARAEIAQLRKRVAELERERETHFY